MIKNKSNSKLNLKQFILTLLVLYIPYINLILDLKFSNIKYTSLSVLSLYLPYFYIFLGISFFTVITFKKYKNLDNIKLKYSFSFMMILLSFILSILLKKIFVIENITETYNSNFFYFIISLIFMNFFITSFNFEKTNLKLILLQYFLAIIIKYNYLKHFNNIFICSSIVYFLLFILNAFPILFNEYKRKKIKHKNINLSNILKLFDFKIFTLIFISFFILEIKYLISSYFINDLGILHNVSSFFLVNIILDMFFIPIYSLFFSNLLLDIENIKKAQIFKTSILCMLTEIIISLFLYLFFNKIIFKFNFEIGILNYSNYIFKILLIYFPLRILSFIIPTYCFFSKNNFLFFYYFLSDIAIFTILLFILKKLYRLNGILFSIPISFIATNVFAILIIFIFKNLFTLKTSKH